jgi:hypothetical protein
LTAPRGLCPSRSTMPTTSKSSEICSNSLRRRNRAIVLKIKKCRLRASMRTMRTTLIVDVIIKILCYTSF